MNTKKYRYWRTKEQVADEASKYTNRVSFKKGSGRAYEAARKNGWLDELCKHMEKPKTEKFSYEHCKEVASVYKTHKQFEKENVEVYRFAKSYGWLPEICNHMNTTPNLSYEDCKQEALKYQTKSDFKKASPSFHRKSVKEGWFDEICSHMTNGHKLRTKWTYESCKKEAMLYKSKLEMRLSSPSAYYKIHTSGWTELFDGMKDVYEYWTYEKCKQEVSKYKTLSEMLNCNKNLYNAIKRNNWVELIRHLYDTSKKPSGYWTKELCLKQSRQYESREDFRKSNCGAYSAAKRNGWLDEAHGHMSPKITANPNHWSYENCAEEARKYNTRKEFFVAAGGAYHAARINDWLDEICRHMLVGLRRVDVVYMWNTIENPNIWKFGVSNDISVDRRIKKVVSQTDFTLNEVLWNRAERAYRIERKLLGIGETATLFGIKDGKTEIRHLTLEEEKLAKQIIMSGA
jgi:hypothetical protein